MLIKLVEEGQVSRVKISPVMSLFEKVRFAAWKVQDALRGEERLHNEKTNKPDISG